MGAELKQRRIVDLSFTIEEGMPVFPVHWHPRVEVQQMGRHGKENRETRKLILGTHTGTHCDAPAHFVPGGKTIDCLPLDAFVGPAFVVNFSKASPGQEMHVEDFTRQIGERRPERVIVRFDWSVHWATERYYRDHPYISIEAAHWLVDRGVKLYGMDTPMPDNPVNGFGSKTDSPIHKILLGHGIVLLEYLCNLAALRAQEIELVALPLKIKGGDGSPVRCAAIEG